jgi:hypothetical protein
VEATERRGTLPGAGHLSPTLPPLGCSAPSALLARLTETPARSRSLCAQPLVFNISQNRESSHSLSHLVTVKSRRAGYGKRFALTLYTR